MNYFYSISLIFIIFCYSNVHSQINTERYRQDSDSGFSGSIDIDALAQTGNTDFQFIGLGGRLNYNRIKSYSFFVFSGGYGWNNGDQFSNELIAHLRNVEGLNNWLQFESFLQFDYNKKRKLLARELIGAGFRYKLLTIKKLKLRAGTTYFYEIESYDLTETSVHEQKINANRFSTYFTFELDLKSDINFLSVSYYQPDLLKFSDYRLISENTLVIVLSELLDFNVKFNLRFDATPPDGIKDLDTITKLGLSFKF